MVNTYRLSEPEQPAADGIHVSRARSTWRAYESDWRIFSSWCSARALPILPATPSTVVEFLTAQVAQGIAPSTLQRRLAAIRLKHLTARLPSPTDTIECTEAMHGIHRTSKSRPARKVPMPEEDVRRLVDATGRCTLCGLRDRAIVLLGFGGALRRSEIVALDVEHFAEVPEGILVRIARSDADRVGEDQMIAVARVKDSPYCPVQAVLDWRAAAEIHCGALFRRIRRGDMLCATRLTDKSVARIIKRCCLLAGLDPAFYAGHSLRRGFLISAARRGASVVRIADHSRHQSLNQVRQYVKALQCFEDHPGSGLLQVEAGWTEGSRRLVHRKKDAKASKSEPGRTPEMAGERS